TFARRRRHLVVVHDHRTRVIAQPFHTLANDAVALAHFTDTAKLAIVTFAIHTNRHIEVYAIIHFVGLILAKVPFNSGAEQHGPGKAHGFGQFRRHDADIDEPLFPDAVVGQQRFVFVDTGWEPVGEVFDEIQQRPGARFVH